MPFIVGANEISVAGSFGIAVYPEDGEDARTLMRHADLAMYNAKAGGAVRWHFFSRELGERVEARLAVENALAGSIERNELSLVYQPKFQAADMKQVIARLDVAEKLWQKQNGEPQRDGAPAQPASD